MTLREQIKQIHAKHFNKEFHEYRGDLLPAMVNDLALQFFDELILDTDLHTHIWYLPDNVEIRAIKLAKGLIAVCQLRENTPAAE
jgi:ABC-type Zn2+ transport system substrate-binding protein/surface adhesin